MPYEDLIEKHFRRVGIDPSWGRAIMRAESGGDPNQTTGRYKGLFQLDDREFKRHGGTSSVFDPEQNTMAAANKMAEEKLRFRQKHGREPDLRDIYLMHQQGEAGYDAHLSNPNELAWKNMQKASGKSEAWSKLAIWGNLTPSQKERYGSVENVTSGAFTNEWGKRIETLEAGGPWTEPKATGEVATAETKAPTDTDKPVDTPKKPSLMGLNLPSFDMPHIQVPNIAPPHVQLAQMIETPRVWYKRGAA